MGIQKRFVLCVQIICTSILFVMIVGAQVGSAAETVENDPFEALQIMKLPEPVDPYDFTLKSIDGEEKKLSDYLGNVIFLNFWATW